LKVVIIDEADEIFGRGFQDDIIKIFKTFPTDI